MSKLSLYDWLREHNMTIAALAKKVKCHPERLRFIQQGKPVCLRIALGVRIATDGQINPEVKNLGRPKKL
ncbi:MAG: hypothetical protein QXF82_07895 [Nitrososphaeria archaeon]